MQGPRKYISPTWLVPKISPVFISTTFNRLQDVIKPTDPGLLYSFWVQLEPPKSVEPKIIIIRIILKWHLKSEDIDIWREIILNHYLEHFFFLKFN